TFLDVPGRHDRSGFWKRCDRALLSCAAQSLVGARALCMSLVPRHARGGRPLASILVRLLTRPVQALRRADRLALPDHRASVRRVVHLALSASRTRPLTPAPRLLGLPPHRPLLDRPRLPALARRPDLPGDDPGRGRDAPFPGRRPP